MTQDALESKREQLEELEKSEKEAQRLEEALGRGRGVTSLSPSPPLSVARPKSDNPSESDSGEQVGDPSEPIMSATEGTAEAQQPFSSSHSEDDAPESPIAPSYLPPHPGPNPVRRRTRAPGMGFLNALSFTLHGMMDVDPETARRNGITKTRETIAQVRTGFFHRLPFLLIVVVASWKKRSICQLPISSIRVRPYKLIWTGSKDKKSRI